MKKVGIFAGTFDPVHRGHVAFAKQATIELALDILYVIPEPSPRTKAEVTEITHRIEMAKQAFSDNSKVVVCPLSQPYATMPGTYTELDVADEEVYLLIGTDVALGLKTWPHFYDMLKSTHFVIGVRSDPDSKRIHTLMAHLGVPTTSYTLIKTSYFSESSSTARTGNSEFHPKIQNYIQKHHLYRV